MPARSTSPSGSSTAWAKTSSRSVGEHQARRPARTSTWPSATSTRLRRGDGEQGDDRRGQSAEPARRWRRGRRCGRAAAGRRGRSPRRRRGRRSRRRPRARCGRSRARTRGHRLAGGGDGEQRSSDAPAPRRRGCAAAVRRGRRGRPRLKTTSSVTASSAGLVVSRTVVWPARRSRMPVAMRASVAASTAVVGSSSTSTGARRRAPGRGRRAGAGRPTARCRARRPVRLEARARRPPRRAGHRSSVPALLATVPEKRSASCGTIRPVQRRSIDGERRRHACPPRRSGARA